MLHNLPFGIRRLYQANAFGVEPTQVIEEVYRRTDKVVDPRFFYLHWSLFF
jgi:hypothetical protein